MRVAPTAVLPSSRMRRACAPLLRRLIVLAAVICLVCTHGTPAGNTQSPSSNSYVYAPASKATYLRLADETEATLRRDVLGVWFPRTVDREHGGFRANFTRAWEPAPSEGKFSVFQGRMTWV